MSNTTARYVLKLNDRDVIGAFDSVRKKFEDIGVASVFRDLFGDLDDDAVEKYRDLAAYSLVRVTLVFPGFHWQWMRLRPESSDLHSATHDKLTFTWNPQQGQGHSSRKIVAEISAELDAALSRPLANAPGGRGFPPLEGHSEILLALESATSKLLVDSAIHREELDRAYLEKENSLNARIDELRERELARIKSEKERNDSEFLERKYELEERQKALDSLQKTLDDRNNTHVRRDIRASLLDITKERLANFSVSKETRFQYWAVHAVAFLGLIALASGAAIYGSQVAVDSKGEYPSAAIALLVKSGALAATAIALGSWYLGWLNRWLQRIADAEFKLQQFRLDIERASWLAETVLEWKSTSQEPFPELLASRLSSGLFTSSSTDVDDPKTPGGHLAEALFGAAASAKIKVGEQEINFDRKSIRGLNE